MLSHRNSLSHLFNSVNNRTARTSFSFFHFYSLFFPLFCKLHYFLFSLFPYYLIVALHDAPLNNRHGPGHMRQTGFELSTSLSSVHAMRNTSSLTPLFIRPLSLVQTLCQNVFILFTQKRKFSDELLIPFLMECQVKLRSSQNISGASKQKPVLQHSPARAPTSDEVRTFSWASTMKISALNIVWITSSQISVSTAKLQMASHRHGS